MKQVEFSAPVIFTPFKFPDAKSQKANLLQEGGVSSFSAALTSEVLFHQV